MPETSRGQYARDAHRCAGIQHKLNLPNSLFLKAVQHAFKQLQQEHPNNWNNCSSSSNVTCLTFIPYLKCFPYPPSGGSSNPTKYRIVVKFRWLLGIFIQRPLVVMSTPGNPWSAD
jgi:hypothetical protein